MLFRWREYAQHHHGHATGSSHARHPDPEVIAQGNRATTDE